MIPLRILSPSIRSIARSTTIMSASWKRYKRTSARQAANGRATPCSRQIFLEARWLTFYSAHWDQIDRRLRDLREMLQRPADPPDSREQIEADGSFDHCSEAWFLKLDSTIEEVEYRTERGRPSGSRSNFSTVLTRRKNCGPIWIRCSFPMCAKRASISATN